MESLLAASYLSSLQKQVLIPSPQFCLHRDTDLAKLTLESFKTLEKKYQKRVTVSIVNSKLSEDHIMPMLVIQDLSSGDIIQQVFNFIDIMGGKPNLTPQGVEKFLMVRGILEPKGGSYDGFESVKDQRENRFVVESSFLQQQLDQGALDGLNHFLAETEKLNEIEIDPATVNYKECIIESYKDIEDPFERQVQEMSYNQNPGDPSSLIKEIKVKERDDM